MMLPDYWLARPSVNVDTRAQVAFDELLNSTLGIGECPTIPFTLPWPKWRFLCHVADQHAIALHGSGNPNITLFEPRQSNDLNTFGKQKAVYAASDGLWAMFFAIVDRDRVTSVTNACVRLADETGTLHGPYYVFSVSQLAPTKSISHSSQVLCRFNPWRNLPLHRTIFLSLSKSAGMMTIGFRNMQPPCRPGHPGQRTGD